MIMMMTIMITIMITIITAITLIKWVNRCQNIDGAGWSEPTQDFKIFKQSFHVKSIYAAVNVIYYINVLNVH